MKPFIKAILMYYMRRQEFRLAIQAAFLKHYQVVPVKGSKKLARKEVFEKVEETLRLAPHLYRRHYMTELFRELGAVPIHAQGYRWFRGIKAKEESCQDQSESKKPNPENK